MLLFLDCRTRNTRSPANSDAGPFGVKKTIKKDDATIEFTPDKSGTIEITCGMSMVKGTLTVTAQ